MALLNYGKTYQELYEEGVLEPLINGETNPNYIKLYFTNDGHIVTHGQDYTFNISSGQGTDGIYTGYGWVDKLKRSQLPIYVEGSSLEETIFSANQVYTLINSKLSESDAWVLKGVVNSNSGLPIDNYKTGWSYRVTEAGTYAGKYCEIGDIIIAVNDYDNKLNDSDWHVIQTNISGYGDGLYFVGPLLSLASATKEKIGGVKIGENINVNNGTISLTKENITDALGYTPSVAVATTFSYKLGFTDNALKLVQVTTEATPDGDKTTETPVSSITFSGANGISVLKTSEGFEIKARDILIEDTSIGSNKLNFLPGGSICILKDSNIDDGITNIGFDLVWYNLDTGKYEYV